MNNKKNQNRFKEIVTTATRYGFSDGFGSPENLRLLLEELGASFVKIGQLLSTRADLLPKEYIDELRKLQDEVAPGTFSDIEKVIVEELGDIDDTFLEFDRTPLASASLAEVHRGKLKTGEDVVIKIQRPYIKEKILADLDIIKTLTPIINLSPTKEIVDMEDIVKELGLALEKELDFLEEKENIKRFKENNKDIKFITSPSVYDKYSTRRIIVMDYIAGIKIDDRNTLENQGYELEDISRKLTYNYFQQVFDHGFFHADPHPGNIMIHENTIGYIDFGLMGSFDASMLKKLNNLLNAVVLNDISQLTRALLSIGIQVGPIDRNNLNKDIEIIYNKYIDESIHNFDIGNILNEMIQVTKVNNIRMPKEITLLAKGMITIQGVLSSLDKNLSIMEVALPYFKNKLINDKFKNIDLFEIGLKFYNNLDSIYNLPIKINRTLDKALEGDLTLNLKLRTLDDSLKKIDRMVNKLIAAIVIAGILISSSLVVHSKSLRDFGSLGYILATFLGMILLVSIFKSDK